MLKLIRTASSKIVWSSNLTTKTKNVHWKLISIFIKDIKCAKFTDTYEVSYLMSFEVIKEIHVIYTTSQIRRTIRDSEEAKGKKGP